MVIEGPTQLPTMVLPNLIKLDVEYDYDIDWLQGFRGATFGKLVTVTFRPGAKLTCDFLKAFESVALTTSATATLSRFRLYTSHLWGPNYRSLLLFTQLRELIIESPCGSVCSASVDNDTIVALARAMPKLETLRLGDLPCREIPTGVTAEGLAVLARHCPDLSVLRVHFQVATLSAPPVVGGMASNAGPSTPQRGCALKGFEVGFIPLPEESVARVALTLVHIFPRITHLICVDENWEKVMEAIWYSPGRAADHPSKEHPPLSVRRCNLSEPPPQEPHSGMIISRGTVRRDTTLTSLNHSISLAYQNLHFLHA